MQDWLPIKIMENSTLLLALLPLILISLGLEIFALVDLYRRDRRYVQGGNKLVWVAVIVLINLVGSIIYLTVGRTEGGQN